MLNAISRRIRHILISGFIASFISPQIHASFDTKKGARPLGMGGAFVAAANTGDALYYNPAGLWLISNPTVLTFYSIPFDIRDLTTAACNFTYPAPIGNATISIESFGFDLYRETTVGFAYSQSFRQRLVYGIAVNYDHLAIKNGGASATIGVDAGFLFKPHEKITVGFSSRNLNRPSIAHDKLPQVFLLGLSYRILDALTLNTDIYKDVKFPTDIRAGAEYQFAEKFWLRIGTGSEPSRFSAGLGFDFGAGTIDYAVYSHPELGVTHALSVSLHVHRNPPREIKN